jgi:hypothetical protein
MSTIPLRVKVSAIDDTKKAFDSVKRNFQDMGGMSPIGMGAAGTARVTGPGGALATAQKVQTKQFGAMVGLLKEISKNTSGMRPGAGDPGRGGGSSLPKLPGGGGGGLGGLGGMMKFLGPLGAALSIGGIGFGMMRKMGSSYKSTASQQLGSIQQLGGTMGYGFGGTFTGMRNRGVAPSQEAAFQQRFFSEASLSSIKVSKNARAIAKAELIDEESKRIKAEYSSKRATYQPGMGGYLDNEYSLANQSNAIRNIKISDRAIRSRALRPHLRSKSQKASDISAAYGIDMASLGGTMGQLERYGDGSDGGSVNQANVLMASANAGGMGGTRMNEFFRQFEQVMTSAVRKGSTASNTSMMVGLGALMKGSNERQKSNASAIAGALDSTMRSGATFQGGAMSGLALSAFMEEEGSLLGARERAAKGFNIQNLQTLFKSVKKRHGTGASSVGNLALMQMLPQVGGPKAMSAYVDRVLSFKPGADMSAAEKAQQQELLDRISTTAKTTELLTAEETNNQLKALNAVSKTSANFLENMDKLWTGLMTGGRSINVRVSKEDLNPELPTTED